MAPQYTDNPTSRLQESAPENTRMDKFEDDLSIVASEEDGSSQDSEHYLRGSGDKSSKHNKAAAPIDLVRRETFGVNVLRYLILISLLGAGVLFGVATFFVVRNADETRLELVELTGESATCLEGGISFSHFVNALDDSIRKTLANQLSAAFTISAQYTSYSLLNTLDPQPTWPQITLPNFEPLTTGVLQTTGALRFLFAPLVDSVRRGEFESYAIEEQTPICNGLEGCEVIDQIYNTNGEPIDEEKSQVLSPIWQAAPGYADGVGQIMWNQFSNPVQARALKKMLDNNVAILSELQWANTTVSPVTRVFYPIFEDFKQATVVGSLSMELDWTALLEQSLPYSYDGALILLDHTCKNDTSNRQASFMVESNGTVSYLGPVDVDADEQLENGQSELISLPTAFTYGELDPRLDSSSECSFHLRLFPNADTAAIQLQLEDEDGVRNRAPGYTAVVGTVFFLILFLFLVYDWLVEKRQSVVVNIATKSTAIVENLFPAQVRDRMLQNVGEKVSAQPSDSQYNGDNATPADNTSGNVIAPQPSSSAPSQVSVKQFLTNMPETGSDMSSQPIADLFPNTTVLFADIAGFTAWSSQREPPQVFTLLETLYRSFDVIAGKLKVFKVETIGDCYMAVTGLPNPDESHAVHMSRFAYQCLIGMKELIRELEAILGPGTSDLALRVGLHSGPVTAGVLRGEKSRFQLFGDTVNTASRMESTGERGKIQVSQETGDLLMAAGKSHWLKPRDEVVVAKGKGELKTYWLDPTKKRRTAKSHKDIRVTQEINLQNGDYVEKPVSPADVQFDDKYARLIDWNVDVLLHHLARVISCRSRTPSRGSLVNHSSEVALLPSAVNDVAEVVALPPFDPDSSRFRRARPDVSMLQQTRADLHEYVKRIALMYRDVPFHNFEHASHVTLCANKLLNRLINSDEYETEEELHNSTFGISSDPLTHFAIVFAALIHDVDHTGLPNAQLVKDEEELAVKFDNKSVAEQNSVHLGWEMLMDPRFERLRKCIYQTNVERKRFRQLVINSVMATDIADRQVNEERQNKWDKAFRRTLTLDEASPLQIQEDMNRKATAVIEHIIQVSDVAHTMQHWHIYRRWNERLFHEMHDAFQSTRVSVDPSTNWYIGELGFFDYYLIPLAMKLKECGVFGASGYEYISYVLKNKKEWERKGRQVVQEMVVLYKDTEDSDGDDVTSESGDIDSDDLEYDSPGDISESDSEVDMDSAHAAPEN